jgi:hypothetical protein
MEKQREGFVAKAGELYDEVSAWRVEHKQASFDEIVAEVRPKRRALMGELLKMLALQAGNGAIAEGKVCEQCGQAMRYKGELKRAVLNGEGDSTIKRAHYYCPGCQSGIFPLDQQLKLGEHSWTPKMVEQAVRVGVEIASYERAAETFVELSGVGLSKSSLQRLVCEYGKVLVKQQAEEAAAMVQPPAKDEVEIAWRQIPQPASETMSVSHDGVMVNIRNEGWKEVKMVSVAAVEQQLNPANGKLEVKLSQQSYRAGLWDAATFANQQWAETEQRGIPKAKRLACVADGAVWIWQLVLMCFSPCFEILDWWHASQRLWTLANNAFAEPKLASAWVDAQQKLWAEGQLLTFFHNVRLLFPKTTPLPQPALEAIRYLFHQRKRMRYAYFRQLGLPIGSGTVESACKVVVQARLKQAGMRWSRPGAQAMLALRCALLSDRWHNTWLAFASP